jgi:thioredoxin-dependent peroxiredoxin
MKILLSIVIVFITIQISSQDKKLQLGDSLPVFSIEDDSGSLWNSKESSSKFLVVYFYPAAMTGGCTKQACAYRDDKASFDALHISVIGISGDEVSNLQYFKKVYNINFPLLSDPNGEFCI